MGKAELEQLETWATSAIEAPTPVRATSQYSSVPWSCISCNTALQSAEWRRTSCHSCASGSHSERTSRIGIGGWRGWLPCRQ